MSTKIPDAQTLLEDATAYADRALNADVEGSDLRQRFALTAQAYTTIALVQTVQNRQPGTNTLHVIVVGDGSRQHSRTRPRPRAGCMSSIAVQGYALMRSSRWSR